MSDHNGTERLNGLAIMEHRGYKLMTLKTGHTDSVGTERVKLVLMDPQRLDGLVRG